MQSLMKNKVILNIILDEPLSRVSSERGEICGTGNHLVKTHFLTVRLIASTFATGCVAASSALGATASSFVTIIVTTTTAVLTRPAYLWRSDFLVSIFVALFLIGPVLLLLFLYLLQSFQSFFILVFVLFQKGKILLRL